MFHHGQIFQISLFKQDKLPSNNVYLCELNRKVNNKLFSIGMVKNNKTTLPMSAYIFANAETPTETLIKANTRRANEPWDTMPWLICFDDKLPSLPWNETLDHC